MLSDVARRIFLQMRTHDSAGRYGGEEFLVVLPGCGGESMFRELEAMRQRIAQHPVETPQGPIVVTASIGAALFDGVSAVSVDDLIAAADQALYAAKNAGRNCVSLATNLAGAGIDLAAR